MNSAWSEALELLEEYDSIFYAMSVAGIPVFTRQVPTAAIQFDREGGFCRFLINPDIWDQSSTEERAFIVGHECLHIILNHGVRGIGLQEDPANVAMDVVINHMLVKNFGFDRDQISFADKFCWFDTVFKEPVPEDEAFEFYYNKLLQEGGSGKSSGGQFGAPGDGSSDCDNQEGNQILDSHDDLFKTPSDAFEQIVNQPGISNDDVEDFKDKIAGNSEGTSIAQVKRVEIIVQKDWNTIVKRESSEFFREKENWLGRNRRYASMSDQGFILPQESEIDERGRKEVWFFQDVSGSCANLLNYFSSAALSFPRDKFHMTYHFFDTRVHQVDESVLKGKRAVGWFGGTRFDIIEDFIIHSGCRYPDAVFIFTDGYGNRVHPQMPERWHWFLSDDHTRRYIPSGSQTYKIQDYATIKS